MKKLVPFLVLITLILTQASVFAGDVPESLMASDDSLVFFAEVIDYHPNKDNPSISVSPIANIKGDAGVGTKQIFLDPCTAGNFIPLEGKNYLFTYYDEHNPTYIFNVSSYDTRTLKLIGAKGGYVATFWKIFKRG